MLLTAQAGGPFGQQFSAPHLLPHPPRLNLPLPLPPCSCPQEARFDRHFVRDLTWSRHQLEELAERRFLAAQQQRQQQLGGGGENGSGRRKPEYTFADLFKAVRGVCGMAGCFKWGGCGVCGMAGLGCGVRKLPGSG